MSKESTNRFGVKGSNIIPLSGKVTTEDMREAALAGFGALAATAASIYRKALEEICTGVDRIKFGKAKPTPNDLGRIAKSALDRAEKILEEKEAENGNSNDT